MTGQEEINFIVVEGFFDPYISANQHINPSYTYRVYWILISYRESYKTSTMAFGFSLSSTFQDTDKADLLPGNPTLSVCFVTKHISATTHS